MSSISVAHSLHCIRTLAAIYNASYPAPHRKTRCARVTTEDVTSAGGVADLVPPPQQGTRPHEQAAQGEPAGRNGNGRGAVLTHVPFPMPCAGHADLVTERTDSRVVPTTKVQFGCSGFCTLFRMCSAANARLPKPRPKEDRAIDVSRPPFWAFSQRIGTLDGYQKWTGRHPVAPFPIRLLVPA